MRKTVVILMLASFLMVTGCISRMEHPTKSSTQWVGDNNECQQTVRKLIREDPDSFDTLDEMKLIETCMKKKGWKAKSIFSKNQ